MTIDTSDRSPEARARMIDVPYESRLDVAPPARAFRRVIVVALLLLGVQLWLLADPALVRSRGYLAVAFASVAVCFAPAVRRALDAFGAWLGRAGPIATPARLFGVSVASAALLYACALACGRPFALIVHDEFSYELQAQMIARGRFWMPEHPVRAFFESFYVLDAPRYASQYFPGAAMCYAPGVWLGLPFWAMPLFVAALACGVAFLVFRELFDGLTALAGVVAICGTIIFRYTSISVFSETPAMLFGWLAGWLVLRWDARGGAGRLVGAGAALGACAVTRPLDALCFAIVWYGLVAWRLRRASPRAWRTAALAGLLALAPFACAQLWINYGVTGRWFQTPFELYASRDMPGTGLGFRAFDASRRIASSLPAKADFYERRIVPLLRGHTPALVWDAWRTRLGKIFVTETLPDFALFIFVPPMLCQLQRARAVAIVALVPIWLLLYALHPFNFFHYYVVLLPATIALFFLGVRTIAEAWPRRAASIRQAGAALTIALGVIALPLVRRDVDDQAVPASSSELALAAATRALPDARAIVLVRSGATSMAEFELVHNVDAAWPDDARVIRAHDFGPRNVELYRYYASRQPDRVVYRFDRADDRLSRLGTVVELAAAATTRP